MTPDRIHVSPAKGLRFKKRIIVNGLTDELLALGYRDDGPHVIEGMPHYHLRLFHHPEAQAYAMVIATDNDGTWAELYCRYAQNERHHSFNVTNTTSPRVGILDKPPGVVRKKRPGVSVAALHQEFLKKRPKGKLLPVVAGGCARAIEESHAYEMDWRNGRGGPTPKEIAKVAALPHGKSGQQDPFKELMELLHAVRLLPAHRRRMPKSLTGAVKRGDVSLVKMFLDRGFDANEETGYPSPLNPAAQDGNLEIVNLLIDHGTSPHRKAIFSPLMNAAEKGHVAILKRLAKAGVDLKKEGPDAMAKAARGGQIEAVRFFLKNGIAADSNEGSALAEAAGAGSLEILSLLFDSGASSDKAGRALLAAATQGQYLVAKLLVAQGVNPTRHKQYAFDLYGERCSKPQLPASYARAEGYRILADFLSGKLINEEAAIAATPKKSDEGAELSAALRDLQEATEGKRLEGTYREGAVLRILELLRLPAVIKRLNERSSKNRYPLQLAAANGDSQVIRAMVKAGATANIASSRAFQPLQEAACNGHRDAVRLLLDAGADPNPKSSGTSPLFGAVEWGEPDLVKLLLDAGADPDAKDHLGRKAFAINAGLYDKEIKALLKEASLRRTGKGRPKGSGILCKRGKKTVDASTARGTRDFKEFFGQPEWAIALVKAPVAAVATEYAAIIKSPRWEQDIAGRNIESAKRSVFILQLRGNEWSLVLRSLGWVGLEELEQLPKETSALSRKLKTRAFTFMAEDTSGCGGYELFENGKSLESAEWTGELKFKSNAGRRKPKFGEDFPDPLFANEGIYLPACWVEDDGREIKLGLEGITPKDIARVDMLVTKE